jgi:fructokinase
VTAPLVTIGEALIDLVETGDDEPRLARPGGSPYNVALGLARLGQHAAFAGRLSRDPLGTVLRKHAERSGVDLSLAVEAAEPTTVALVELAADGSAQYRFGVEGTADFQWTDAELRALPHSARAVHFGSLASWLPPGDAAIARRIAALHTGTTLVSYDPNLRPHLQPDRAATRNLVENAIRLADLVKASADDLAWVRPGEPADRVAHDWLALGPTAVVVTDGGAGATAYTAAGETYRAGVPVEVVDTVGAGDAFMSGLLDALARRHLLDAGALVDAPWPQLLDDAALVAALTCSRAGANPPRRAELAAASLRA